MNITIRIFLMLIFYSINAYGNEKIIAYITQLRGIQPFVNFNQQITIDNVVESLKHTAGMSGNSMSIASYTAAIPTIVWQLIFIVLFWLCCICLIYNKTKKRSSIVLGVLCACSAVPLGYGAYLTQRRFGIVCSPGLAIYVGPGNTYPVKCYLPLLTEVCIKKESKSDKRWIYISNDQISGWTEAQTIREYTYEQ